MRFKEAIVLRGTKSNTRIAEMVGTKTARQVSSYKIRYLKKNPIWETMSDPPSVSSVTTNSTNSPQNDLTGDSGSSVLSPGSQQLGESARVEGPPQGSLRLSPAAQLSTPSPSLSDLLKGEGPEEGAACQQYLPTNPRNMALLEKANNAIRILRTPARSEGVESPVRQSQ